MRTIKNNVENEIIIDKSRFITHLIRVNSVDQANKEISIIKKKYYDADHNCYAFICPNTTKSSDDKEPSKTAGIPILEALKKNNISNVLCVVTRYFGGIKLGSGGLIRAYLQSASEAIKKAKLVDVLLLKTYLITIDYSLKHLIDNYSSLDLFILEKTYAFNVTYKIATKNDCVINHIIDLVNKKAIIENTDPTIVEIEID